MVKIENGKGELEFIEIENQSARASICRLGATVTEYQLIGSQPVLWTSPNSRYQVGVPIRAGIPVCWPWFGQPSDPLLPSHGFVRSRLWEVRRVEDAAPDRTVVELGCTDDETRALWPHHYDLRLRVEVGAQLVVSLLTTNRDSVPLPFSAALHTYFAISDITAIQVDGLENVPFLSKVHDFAQFVQAEPVRFSEPIDRVYLDSASTCVLHDPGWRRRIIIEKEGSRTTVVWNPWAKAAAEMPDLGADTYRRFVCVETVVGPKEQRVLPPGETHTLTARIKAEDS